MLFAINKLAELSPEKRAEKCAIIFLSAENELFNGKKVNSSYIKQISALCSDFISAGRKYVFNTLSGRLPDYLEKKDIHSLETLRHILLAEIGKEPAEWDLHHFSFDKTKKTEREILPINIYIDSLRSPFNVGSIFRTAESFCFDNIFVSDMSPSPTHPRAKRSSMGTTDSVNWSRGTLDILPRPVFALETGGTYIDVFDFPAKGTVIIGSEETGVSPSALKAASSDGGIVTIPLYGLKGSINAGVAFGILAYCWVNSIRNS
ncbi:MAG: TrmH family RNA methyltransferase [Spirochaetia bacterium]|jgi:TrmH family RNA methyltransferase|nr:TrmH family RNA methyltransferase [Spirochaetia bacterium]